MGLTFNGTHSDKFGMCFQTKSMPYIAQKRQITVEVQGLDGQHVFEDGYNNIQIELACTIGGGEILDRRKQARLIAAWLATTGSLIFDYERDIEYEVVKVTNNIVASMLGREYKDEFTVIFECSPHPRQTYYNDELTWEEEIPWEYINIPWNGYNRKFTVYPGQTIAVENAGTYKAIPIIILTGGAISVTFGGFTFTNLSGTVYIDCKNKVVYSLSGNVKINEIRTFTGVFPELMPGTNQFTINGTFTILSIEFDYKNTYL